MKVLPVHLFLTFAMLRGVLARDMVIVPRELALPGSSLLRLTEQTRAVVIFDPGWPASLMLFLPLALLQYDAIGRQAVVKVRTEALPVLEVNAPLSMVQNQPHSLLVKRGVDLTECMAVRMRNVLEAERLLVGLVT